MSADRTTFALSPKRRTLLEAMLRQAGAQGDHGDGIRPRRDGGPAPLSFAQERLWFLEQLRPGSPAYNMYQVLPLPGPVDAAVLARAVTEIVRRHATLRTTFHADDDGRPVQAVHPPSPVPLAVEDLGGLKEADKEREARRIADGEALRPFDLAAGPLLRTTLIRLGPDRHALVVAMHHVASDGWSIPIFFRELGAIYAAFAAGEPSPLADPPIQYTDFAAWQREHLRGETLEGHLAYWREALAGAPPVLPLVTDRPRPPVQGFRGALHGFRVPGATAEGVRSVARRMGATPFMVLLAAFQALLHRWGAGEDVVVGSPIANRTKAETEGLIGFFVNTLVLRGDLSGDPPFETLVGRVRDVTLAAYAHQELPFEKLVEELHPARNLSHNPLFQVAFALQTGQGAEPRDAAPVPEGAPVAPEASNGTAKFDLMLSLADAGGGYAAAFEFSTDLFDGATVERMADHFLRLLAAAVDAPGTPLSALPLLSDPERHAVLHAINGTAVDVDPWETVVVLFDAIATRRPDATALVQGATGTTYGELRARANRLANHLRRRGIGPEGVVGVCMDRSVDWIVALLACWKAGAAYLPLDPAYPPGRLAFMARDAGASLVLAGADTRERVADAGPPVLCVQCSAAAVAAEPDGDPGIAADTGTLAYVIYTSGSTGTPKGVLLAHGGLRNVAAAQAAAFAVAEDDRVLQLASIGFDASVFEVVMALTSGAALHLPPPGAVRTGPELGALLRDGAITHATLSPGALATVPPEPLPALRALAVAGEACPPGLAARWAEGRAFWNLYGPTETTIWATAARLSAHSPAAPIGTPIANARAYVLDGRMRPVPIDAPGELYVGGAGVARGYVRRPALTAERFVPDPFGASGSRLYRTGDVCRLRAEGVLEFLGRADQQVKLRGFRVEPGEVEAVLAAHPQVATAAVVARMDAGGAHLVAYVAPRPGTEAPSSADLRAFARGRLPEHMVPAVFVPIDALPLTPSGKVDRARLPDPSGARPELDQAYVAPRTPAEAAVAAIWGELLGMERVGVEDDFFALGGHSLLLTRAASRIRATFGVEVPLRALFESPTIAAAAALLPPDAAPLPAASPESTSPESTSPESTSPESTSTESTSTESTSTESASIESASDDAAGSVGSAGLDSGAGGGASESAGPGASDASTGSGPSDARPSTANRPGAPAAAASGRPAWSRIEPVPRDGRELPLSFAQERLWLLHQLQPGSPAYTIPLTTRIPLPMSVPALERTLTEIARRHEPLRTTFRLGADGRPVQVVHPPAPVRVEVIDLRHLEPAARDEESQRIIFAEARKPFDLTAGPLLRTTVVRIGETDQLLLFTMHHIVSDGWSMGVFFRELGALFTGYMGGPPVSLPELPVQYADFAVWQRGYLSGETLRRHLAYWRGQLEGAPPVITLPADRPRPPAQSFRGSTQGLVVPGATMNRLRELTQASGATLFMTLLAGFTALLHRCGAGDDVVVGSPIANRTRAELEGLIGFFVNTLVLRTDLSGDPSFRTLLERVKDVTLGAFAHQDLPFEKLVEELQPERNLSHNPIFQVLFVLQPPSGPVPRADADEPPPPPPPPGAGNEAGTAKFDLTLSVQEMGSALVGGFEYALDLFDPPTAERLCRYYTRLLAAAAERPDAPLSTLDFMDEAERRTAIDGWNGAVADFDPLPLHVLFDRQAERTPDAVALVHGAEEVTYDGLRHRANRLANRLRGMGMGPEGIAGVCLDRGPDLVVALLAVLKAGGAYVPLDPAYPAERVAYMLRDSRARVVLTSARWRETMADGGVPVLRLDETADAPGAEDDSAPETGVVAENLAYVIYTSGSTGTPKGVAIQHRSATALVAWARRALAFPPGTAMLAGTSVCFDLSVFELFASLANGLRVVLADNVLALPRLPARDRVEVVNSVPSVVGELLKAGPLPPSVHTVILAGEPLPAPLVRALHRQPTVRAVLNAYGPSEDTTYSTVAVVDPADPYPPIGVPVDNTRGYVLDGALRPVPRGVLGELYLAGEGLARGYLGRPALTAERFVPDPHGPLPGARMYRTGDVCRHRADGTLDYLGRADAQVKVRGFRVEPGEVEAVLAAHPDLAACAVVAARQGADRRLAAYAVTRPGAEAPAAADLRAYLKARLPEYMVPSLYIPMDALPLTPSGKIDRRRLPEPEAAGSEGERYVEPRTPREAALAGIWREVLGVARVGAEDDFFELGGHSLMATQVVSRIREAFGVEVPLPAFFEQPTVAALAALVEAGAAADAGPIPRASGRIPIAAGRAGGGVAHVAELSDDEVMRLLLQAAGGTPSRGGGTGDGHPPASTAPAGSAGSAGSPAATAGTDASAGAVAGSGTAPGASVEDLSDDEVTAMLTRLMERKASAEP